MDAANRYQKWAFLGSVILCLMPLAVVLQLPRQLVFGSDLWAIGYLAVFSVVSLAVCYALAKRKGYHLAFALFGLLNLPGFWILLLLPDRNRTEDPTASRRLKRFQYAALAVSVCVAVAVVLIVDFGVTMLSTECDRQAHKDISSLGAALEGLANELANRKCPLDRDRLQKQLKLEYLVGKYYGWRGVNRKYGVRLRIVGREVWGCSERGHRSGPDNHHHIYRVSLFGGAELPAKQGPCEGRRYGDSDAKCYESTMVKENCVLAEPGEHRPCMQP